MRALFKFSSTSRFSSVSGQGTMSSSKLSIVIIFSLVLMFLDYQGSFFSDNLRSFLSTFAQPFRFIAHAPFGAMEYFRENFSSQESLLKENKKLRKEQAFLSIRLQKWKALEQENLELHALLKTVPQIDGDVLGARIVSMNIQKNSKASLILNRGLADGVFIGQPVLDAKGLIGQIIRVDHFNSVVLLMFDLKSAIPVEVVRTGERGILTGTGSMDTLLLNNLPKTSQVRQKDVLITSSLGRSFPAGYPIGSVRSVQNKPAEMFSKILVSPVSNVQQDREVFLLWPNAKLHSYIIPLLFSLPKKSYH